VFENTKRKRENVWANVIYDELYSNSKEANKQPPNYHGINVKNIKREV